MQIQALVEHRESENHIYTTHPNEWDASNPKVRLLRCWNIPQVFDWLDSRPSRLVPLKKSGPGILRNDHKYTDLNVSRKILKITYKLMITNIQFPYHYLGVTFWFLIRGKHTRFWQRTPCITLRTEISGVTSTSSCNILSSPLYEFRSQDRSKIRTPASFCLPSIFLQ